MAKQTITHYGPNGRTNDEEQAQNDFAKQLEELTRQRQAELDAERSRRDEEKRK